MFNKLLINNHFEFFAIATLPPPLSSNWICIAKWLSTGRTLSIQSRWHLKNDPVSDPTADRSIDQFGPLRRNSFRPCLSLGSPERWVDADVRESRVEDRGGAITDRMPITRQLQRPMAIKMGSPIAEIYIARWRWRNACQCWWVDSAVDSQRSLCRSSSIPHCTFPNSPSDWHMPLGRLSLLYGSRWFYDSPYRAISYTPSCDTAINNLLVLSIPCFRMYHESRAGFWRVVVSHWSFSKPITITWPKNSSPYQTPIQLSEQSIMICHASTENKSQVWDSTSGSLYSSYHMTRASRFMFDIS